MTKFLIASDLHGHEGHVDWTPPEGDYDAAIFAGDISSPPAEAIRWIRRQRALDGNDVVYVAGNHESYEGIIEDRIAEGKAVAGNEGIHFLDADDVPVIGGVRVLGCTLWTDYLLGGNQAANMQAALRINDSLQIRTSDGTSFPSRFWPSEAYKRHVRERAWLEARLAEDFDGPTICVSHHAPHPGSIHPKYGSADGINASFASDLSGMILRYQPALFVHGHVHDNHDYMIGDTRIICNPRGYPRYHHGHENKGFIPDLVVEVPELKPRMAP